jgi:hypothetical protein
MLYVNREVAKVLSTIDLQYLKNVRYREVIKKMRKKIFGIVVLMLLITATTLPIVETFEKDQIVEQLNTNDGSCSISAIDDDMRMDFGVDYVNHYVNAHDLSTCDDEAYALYDRLINRLWHLGFFNGNVYADEHDFTSFDEYYVDNVDLAVYSGHGSYGWDWRYNRDIGGVFLREDPSSDYFITPGDVIESDGTGRWGDKDLEWIAFSCCVVFRDTTPPGVPCNSSFWKNAFDGLHLMLGYKTTMADKNTVGHWIHDMTLDTTSYRVGSAWFHSVDKKQPKGKIAEIFGETEKMINDYLWAEGYVNPDPIHDKYNYCWTHKKGSSINIPHLSSDKSTDKMMYYSVIPKEIDKTYVSNLSTFFGIYNDTVVYDNGTYYMYNENETKILEVNDTEGISFDDTSKLWIPFSSPPDLPSLEEAEEISLSYLDDCGLLPSDFSNPDVIYSDYQTCMDTENNTEIENFSTYIQVGLNRNIEGYPVVGPGSSCLVYIGDGEKICGLTKIWRDLEPMGYVDIMSESEAIDLFDTYGPSATFYSSVPPYDDYEVTDIGLGYYEDGYGDSQDFLIPVYLVAIDFRYNNVTYPEIVYIPASFNYTTTPIPVIISPEDGLTFKQGEKITFSGECVYGNPATYEWESDVDGYLGSGTTIDVSNLSVGIKNSEILPHTITFRVIDRWGYEREAFITVKIIPGENNPPNKPKINGPKIGKVGENLIYKFTSSDPEINDVSYYIDWGDGTITDWTTSQASSTSYSENHTWITKDTYTIKAKARDIYGAESDWATLNVRIPRNRIQFIGLSDRFPNLFPLLQKILYRLG